MELKGRVPSLKDIKLQAAALRTAASVGLAAAPVAGAAALELVSQVNTPTAEAAGACDPNKKDYKFTAIVRRVPFFDIGGKQGSFDLGVDPWLEVPVTGGSVKAVDSKSGAVFDEKSYITQLPSVPLFQAKQGEQKVAWAVLTWIGGCDSTVSGPTVSGKSREVASKRVKIVESQDINNQSVEFNIPSEGFMSIWNGRNAATAQNFLDEYNRNPALARDLSPQTLGTIRERATIATATPTVVPTPTFTPVPEAAARSVQVENSLTDRLLGLLTPAAILVAGGLAFLGLSRVRQSVDDAGHTINDQMTDINTNLQGTNTHLGTMNNTLDNIANTADEINSKLP